MEEGSGGWLLAKGHALQYPSRSYHNWVAQHRTPHVYCSMHQAICLTGGREKKSLSKWLASSGKRD